MFSGAQRISLTLDGVEHGQTLSSKVKVPKPVAGRATHLTILCRGATSANQQSRFSATDALLPKEQARLKTLAGNLRPFDTVLHAPERAAAETAAAFSTEANACSLLRDVAYGTWENRTVAEVTHHWPEDLEHWSADPASAPHGGESFAAAQARSAEWLEGYHAVGGNTLAVSHAIIIKLLFLHVVGAPLTSIWRIDVAPLGTLALSSDGKRWAVRGFGAGAIDSF